MATLASKVVTLADYAKRRDPDGKIAKIAELLSQTNGILADMHWREGNLPTGHRLTMRTGLPDVYFRLTNQGVPVSKSRTAQADEGCAIMEAWSEVDVAIARLEANVKEFRLSESMAFIEAMNQKMAETLFYGNTGTNPEEFTGLSVRYSSTTAGNGQNIILGGGVGADNTSIWLCVWGPETVFGVFPKGSDAGLTHTDLGLQVIETTAGVAGSRLQVYQEKFEWNPGLALKDWRYVVRIPNIDVSNLVAKSSNADIIELMIKAIHRIPNLAMGKPCFYMNRTVFQMLDIYRRDDVISGGGLDYMMVDGEAKYSFRGIPVRICEAINESEDLVS
jgi:hypothetical protein